MLKDYLRNNEFILFSDTHYYNNLSRSYTLENGISSWLQIQLDITESIFNYARKNNIETVIINGDIFEEKDRIKSSLYNPVWKLYNKLGKEFNIIINQGNHDFSKNSRETLLTPFSDNITVITEPTDCVTSDLYYRFLPSGMVKGNLGIDCAYKSILFTHEVIADVHPNITSEFKKQIFGDFDKVFNGHIHMPVDSGNIINIGSFMQQEFSEENQQKRFIHFKNEEVIIKPIPILYPEFLTIDINDINKKMREEMMEDSYNIYRVSINSSELADPLFQRFNIEPNVIKSKTEERTVRLYQDENDGNEEKELEMYLEIADTDDFDTDELLEIGIKILKEV